MSYALVGEFTVKAARNRGNIPNTNGPGELTRWYVDFVDANGEPVKDANGKVADAYWQRKPDAEVKPGDTVYGTITEGQYGLRFKMEKKPDGSFGGGSSGGGKAREWKPEAQFDPEKTARIGRAHAQGMAVEVCKAMGVFEGNSAEQIYSKLLGWINWFAADVDQAGQAASQTQGSASPPKEGARSGASPASDSSPANDEHQWFKNLLEAAHMEPEPAHVLAEFIVTKFSSEQKARAESGLEDFNSQMETMGKLKDSYAQMEKRSLPSGVMIDGSDIPFARPEYGEVFDERMRWRFR